MRPVTVSQTGVGNLQVPLDWRSDPNQWGVGCIVSGTATYNVEHTYDNTNWFTDANMTAKTANAETSYPGPTGFGPFQALRLNVTAGTGTVAMTVVAAG